MHTDVHDILYEKTVKADADKVPLFLLQCLLLATSEAITCSVVYVGPVRKPRRHIFS